VTELDRTVRFVLKDGVEIHRIGPPEVYDYETGKLVGRVGAHRTVGAVGTHPEGVEASPSKMGNVEILDYSCGGTATR